MSGPRMIENHFVSIQGRHAMFKEIALGMGSLLMAGAVHGQQLDPVTKWATIAEYEFPLSMNISYQRAISNNAGSVKHFLRAM